MKAKLRRRVRFLDEEERKGAKRQILELIGKNGMYPLNAPGMPPPGPNFLRIAGAFKQDTTRYEKKTAKNPGIFEPGEVLKELYRRALREPGFTLDIEVQPGKYREVIFVPGHLWGQHIEEWHATEFDPRAVAKAVDGPHPADVMVLGKMPWRAETQEGRNLVEATGEILLDACRKLHITNMGNWYVTNILKFMPPDDTSKIKMPWVHDCLPLLHQELRIVRPRYILCLGADASKVLLGTKFNVSYMAGRVVPYTYQVQFPGEEPAHHTAHVMTVLHPAEVSRSPEKRRILDANMARFAYLLDGHNVDLVEKDLDHRVITTLEEAEAWVEEVDAYFVGRRKKNKLIAWDAEWQGQHPINPGSYLRTVQASWAEKKAVCFKITHAGGKVAFRDQFGKPAVKRLMKLLQRFMHDKRAVGHFLVSDLEWLQHYGFDPTRDCPVPLHQRKGKQPWELMQQGEGWIDTAYINHAIEETAPLGLEMLTMRYTSAPRYDIPLEDAIRAYCAKRGIKREALEGYGDIEDDILVPYANYDSDCTLRAANTLLPLLDHDYEGNDCWEAFWESMIIQKPILRMHQNGIQVDRARVDQHTRNFLTARSAKEEELQEWAKWKEFNIRSTQYVREFLFGENLSGKRDKNGRVLRIRPPGARSLYITPLLDTSKPPRLWADLKEKGLDRDATPGTGKAILSILAQDNPNVSEQIGMVRDHRFLDQVLKSVLRHPRTDEEDNWIENDDGFLEYDAGLVASVDCDGRVRSHLYPTAETGRWKSSRPNLQNLSKSRDPDYERMLGKERYKHKLRSVLVASPGYAFLEFDYMGAELYMMAIMSGSTLMQAHCMRALLAEDDPNYYDIHSNVAVLAFRLPCPPTKSGLKAAGKSHFRTLAKNVIFGIAYGRGAKAIALSAKEQGITVTEEDAQVVIDAIFALYPELVDFFNAAKDRATRVRWMASCFRRRRRFPSTEDYKMEGEFERQAMNFPIQSGVASCVDRGLAYLDEEICRQGLEDDLRLLLQVHDAGLLEAKYDLIPYAIDLVRWAMIDQVPIYPTSLDGVPLGTGPYYLGLDFSVEKAWGEKYSPQECKKYGIPLCYAGKA